MAKLDPVVAESGSWTQFRSEMPVSEKWAYFDHAAVAPLPARCRDAIVEWTGQAAENGDAVWPNWARRLEAARGVAADMIAAKAAEIAFVPNTTAGITLVAEGFPFQPGDNIVTFANEFPSNLYPWMAQAYRGVETRRVPVDDGIPDLKRLEEACDDRTRIISVSWIGYGTGWRLNPANIAEIADRVGALFFLDAIQGLGVFPLDVDSVKVDFLAADGHKWMLGPEGAGLFYCRGEHLETLRATGVGWNSVSHRYDFKHIDLDLRDSAARFEGGSQNMVGLHGLAASLDLLFAYGVGSRHSRIAERILEITDHACERLQSAGARIISQRNRDSRSGIVVFEKPGTDSTVLRNAAMDAGVVICCRGGGVRIRPDAFNNESDIERLVEVFNVA